MVKELSLNNFHISGRYPPPAKAHPIVLLREAGSGRRVASLEMWKLFQDNSQVGQQVCCPGVGCRSGSFAVNGHFGPSMATGSCAVVHFNFVDDAVATEEAVRDRAFSLMQATVDVNVL